MQRTELMFETIPDAWEEFGEPCSNCVLFHEGAFCAKGHHQKRVGIATGHMPELTVRRIAGCPDHEIKEGIWWHEEPPQKRTDDYGGSATSLI